METPRRWNIRSQKFSGRSLQLSRMSQGETGPCCLKIALHFFFSQDLTVGYSDEYNFSDLDNMIFNYKLVVDVIPDIREKIISEWRQTSTKISDDIQVYLDLQVGDGDILHTLFSLSHIINHILHSLQLTLLISLFL